MVYQQTLQAKLHSLGYPDPAYKEVKICETEERNFKVNVLVQTKTGIKSWPGFGLRPSNFFNRKLEDVETSTDNAIDLDGSVVFTFIEGYPCSLFVILSVNFYAFLCFMFIVEFIKLYLVYRKTIIRTHRTVWLLKG